MVDLPEPAIFLIPASRHLLKFNAMARLIKLKHAIKRIEPVVVFMKLVVTENITDIECRYNCTGKSKRQTNKIKEAIGFFAPQVA